MDDLLDPHQPGTFAWFMSALSVLTCALACCAVLYASAFVRSQLAENRLVAALQQDPPDELSASRSLAQIKDWRTWRALLPVAKPPIIASSMELKLLELLVKLETGRETEARQVAGTLIAPARDMVQRTGLKPLSDLATSLENYEQTLISGADRQNTLDAALNNLRHERRRLLQRYTLLTRGTYESLQIPPPSDSEMESMRFYEGGLLMGLPAHPSIPDQIQDEDSLGLLAASAQAKGAGERAVEIMKGKEVLRLLERSREDAKALKDEIDAITKQETSGQEAVNSLKEARRYARHDLSKTTREALISLAQA